MRCDGVSFVLLSEARRVYRVSDVAVGSKVKSAPLPTDANEIYLCKGVQINVASARKL